MKHILKISFVLLLLLMAQQGFSQTPKSNTPKPKPVPMDTSLHLSYKILNSPNNTYGYDVLINSKLKGGIHQPNIPGLPGNDGFKTKEGATKVAQLVIKKMKKGEMPPTVTTAEMKKLKAI